MNYIISPLWVYLYEVIGALDALMLVISIICAICAAIFLIALGVCWTENADKEVKHTVKSMFMWFLIATIVSAVCNIATPSRDTMIYMQVAKLATTDNLELVVETTKDATNYVIEAVKSLTTDQ